MNEMLNFTANAAQVLKQLVALPDFQKADAHLIYDALQNKVPKLRFADYLKRYIYEKKNIQKPYSQMTQEDFKQILKQGFEKSYSSLYFEDTTTKLSAAISNCLRLDAVSRKMVFLLGFALEMTVDEVNMLLSKGLGQQQINPKHPEEAVCWYCYMSGYDYRFYQDLMWQYAALSEQAGAPGSLSTLETAEIRDTLYGVADDRQLMDYLCRLKGPMRRYSRTAQNYFFSLYDESRKLIAKLFTQTKHLEDPQWTEQYQWTQISANQVEQVLYAGIPRSENRNLQRDRDSALAQMFPGMRLSKNRICKLLGENGAVSRYDLINLNFFIWSQKFTDDRFHGFTASTDRILTACFMQPLIIQNPYENFVLSCMCTEDPLVSFGSVWEKAYTGNTAF